MRNQEIRETVTELQELYAQADSIKALIVERESLIKEEMESRETETLDLGNCIIRWTSTVADRLATKEVKEYLKTMKVLDQFIKQVASRRFSIA